MDRLQLRTIVTTHAVRWIRIGPPREKGLYNGAFGESKFVTGSRDAIEAPQHRDEDYDGQLQMSPMGERTEEREQEGEVQQDIEGWFGRMVNVVERPIGEQKKRRRQRQQVIDIEVWVHQDCGEHQRRKTKREGS